MVTETPNTHPNRRHEERRPVELRAFAVAPAGSSAEVVISDLSYAGCGMECRPVPKSGDRLELRVVRLGVIQAEVCWADDGRAGCRFLP